MGRKESYNRGVEMGRSRQLLALFLLITAPLVAVVYRQASATLTNTQVKTTSSYGNGVTTNYTIGFPFQANSQIQVQLHNESTTPYSRTVVVYGAGAGKYTITGGDPGTTVVMGTAPTTTQKIVILRVTPLTQPVDYVETEAFPAEDHEEHLDAQTQGLQEVDALARSKVGLSTASPYSPPTFPDPLANKFPVYNSTASDLTLAPLTAPITGDVLKFNTSIGWSTYNVDASEAALLANINTRALQTDFLAHKNDLLNPHVVTAAQIGHAAIATEVNNNSSQIDWDNVSKSGASLADIPTRSHTVLSNIGTNTHTQIDTHISNTSNPHSVTATQVGNATAQWNADRIRGTNVDAAAIGNGKVLTYNSGTGNIEFLSSGTLPSIGAANTVLNVDSGGSTTQYTLLVNANVDAAAAIVDTKLATISTAGKVSNSATTGTSTASADTLVLRGPSGEIGASTVTAASLVGTLTGNVTGDVTGNASTATAFASNPTDCSAGTKATGIDASGNLTCSAVSVTADISGITPVSNGGTGASTLSAEAVLIGNGTGAVSSVAPGANNNVLTSNGTSWVSTTGGGGGGIYTEGQNLITNNSWKSDSTGWTSTATGTGCSGSTGYARETSAANVVPPGVGSACFDSAATGETLIATATTITAADGISSRAVTVSCAFKAASGTATNTLEIWDGSNILGGSTISSSTSGFIRTSFTAIAPASGTITARIKSVASNEPVLYIDDCYLGLAEGFNISQVSQAQFTGSGYFAPTASCVWSRTNTAIGAFGTTAACPGPTVEFNPGPGSIQTTDADLPQVTVNSLPPGYYEVTFSGSSEVGTSNGQLAVAINDGATTSSSTPLTSDTTSMRGGFTVIGHFNYTTAGNKTFALYGAASVGAIKVNAGQNDTTNQALQFSIKRFPTSAEQAYRPDQTPASWSGYVSAASCSLVFSSASYVDPTGDADCNLNESYNRNFGTVSAYGGATEKSGIIIQPPRTGRYFVKASIRGYGATNAQQYAYQLWDGTNVIDYVQWDQANNTYGTNQVLSGIVDITSIATTKTLSIQGKGSSGNITVTSSEPPITWTIFELDAAMPTPLLVNSKVQNSSGVTKDLSAVLNCDAGSSITSQSGSITEGVSTIGNISSGVCAGTFAGMWSSTSGLVCHADLKGSTLDEDARIDVTSATAFSLYCIKPSTGAALTTCDVSVTCSGPR